MMRRAVVGVLLAVLMVTAAPSPVDASAVEGPSVRQVVNMARATGYTCGGVWYPPAAPVKANKRLRKAARVYAGRTAAAGYLSHAGFPGRVTKAGYRWRWAGEVLAGGQRTTVAVVVAWLNSPGHCRVLMSPHARDIGVGRAVDGNGRVWWVAEFGRRR